MTRLLAVVVLLTMGTLAAATPGDLPRLQSGDLQYQGAFRVPQGTSGESEFGYGGAATAYYGANDSLFISGHIHNSQYVAEISIPAPAIADSVFDLPTATVMQPFADITDGIIDIAEPDTLGGLLVDGDRLVFSAYEYYDADVSVFESHGTSTLDLSLTGDATGLHQVGVQNAGLVAGYMAHVPTVWQSALGSTHVTGQANIPITTRTSDGPALFGFNTSDLGTATAPVTPLAAYPFPDSLMPIEEQNVPNEVFNRADEITGVAFPEGSRSVLFFGTHGMGAYCYGTGGEGGVCPDPVHVHQGTHAYPYRYQVWAYDALDLVDVANGEVAPHEVQPHDVWELTLPFAPDTHRLGAVSYDGATDRLFVPQLDVLAYQDDLSVYPVVHVFQLATPGPTADLSGDGFVDGEDLGILLAYWGETSSANFGELDGVQPVDGADLGILLGAWNPPPTDVQTQAVPEPASVVLLFVALSGYSLTSPRRGNGLVY